jgi:multidrug resistance efflux pump
LDHAVRHGDSLVGIDPDDYAKLLFGSNSSQEQYGVKARIEASAERAKKARRAIQDAPDDTDEAKDTDSRPNIAFQDCPALVRLKSTGRAPACSPRFHRWW